MVSKNKKLFAILEYLRCYYLNPNASFYRNKITRPELTILINQAINKHSRNTISKYIMMLKAKGYISAVGNSEYIVKQIGMLIHYEYMPSNNTVYEIHFELICAHQQQLKALLNPEKLVSKKLGTPPKTTLLDFEILQNQDSLSGSHAPKIIKNHRRKTTMSNSPMISKNEQNTINS